MFYKIGKDTINLETICYYTEFGDELHIAFIGLTYKIIKGKQEIKKFLDIMSENYNIKD